METKICMKEDMMMICIQDIKRKAIPDCLKMILVNKE